jgi:hypothetical protein
MRKQICLVSLFLFIPILAFGRQTASSGSSYFYSNSTQSLSELPYNFEFDKYYLVKPTASVGGTRAFAIIGFVLPAPLIGLTTAAGLSDDFTSGTILGASALLLGGVGIPLVAAAGSRMRKESGSRSSLGIIITGWALYGIAMANGVVAVGLSASEIEVPLPVGLTIAILGSASSILFGVEAMNAANDASGISAFRIQPLIGFDTTLTGKLYQNIGVRIMLTK